MSEKGVNLELSDDQRENVRALLSKFSGKKSSEKKQKNIREQDQKISLDPDPLEESPPGSTIEWEELTPKTRRYAFVRETYVRFVPYILDKIPITMEQLNTALVEMGITATSQNEALTVCSVVQADPIRVIHIQTELSSNNMYHITSLRYIV